MDANEHLYLQIAENLRQQIITRQLEPGDRLPTVRELAEQWGCTPGTVNRAYQMLTHEGLVFGNRGRGTRVSSGLLQTPGALRGWASLVHRAEGLLLEALAAGHTPVEVETAMSVAVQRYNELHATSPSASENSSRDTAELRFSGSHDLLVERLAHLLPEAHPQLHMQTEFTGSLGGLIALARRSADLAGVHLWDESTDSYNLPFVRRLLPGQRVALLTLAHRPLGLIAARGNPLGIQGLADLHRPGLRFVNRQPGSGSRVWLDAQLNQLGIDPASIDGYTKEETTHLGVARQIANGQADLGLGIFAAAASAGLHFIPLTSERYDLVIPSYTWDLPAMQALVEIVRSPRLAAAMIAMGGYDGAQTGQVTWI